MTGWMAGALAAGVFGSAHCIGMCGGFATACAGRGGGTLAWHVGRLSTYAALGALAGAAGGAIPGPGWVPSAVAAVLLVWFAGRLAGLLPDVHLPIPGLRWAAGRLLRRRDLLSRVGFGAVTGLVPCGLVYAALAVPVALGDPSRGALAMLLFGAGTVPALSIAAVGLARLTGQGPWVRRGVAAVVLVAGLWSLAMRHPPAEAADPGGEEAPACH